MNIGPGNIEALLLDALEGRLSAAEAELVWAALEAHPEWGVSWDFEDRELPRLQAEDVPPMDWTGLKKEVVTDQQIRQALRQDRDRHTLDATVKQSLYRREERVMWRYWTAAASVALVFGLLWWGNQPTKRPSLATEVEQNPVPSNNTYKTIDDSTSAAISKNVPIHVMPVTKTETKIRAFVGDRNIIEDCSGPPEPLNQDNQRVIEPTQNNAEYIAQIPDSASKEAPLELPFKVQEMPRETAYLAQHIKPNSQEISSEPLTPAQWLKKKAAQIAARKEADGTLPTVRRDQHSFEMHWGSLSINAH